MLENCYICPLCNILFMELAQVTFQQMESIMNTLVELTKIKKYDVGYI